MEPIKKPALYSYVFGTASVCITIICLAGVYVPMHFSTPFFEAIRASTNAWLGVFFSVPVFSLIGGLLCHREAKRERERTVAWWINCAACWGIFLWSVCLIALAAMLALFVEKCLL